MTNGQDKKTTSWYVMRAYKNEKTAEERLANEKYGLEYFIPKEKVIRTVNGRKIVCMVPVIHSLVFVHASQKQIVDFKLKYYNDLQFVTWKTEDGLIYLTVPEKEMKKDPWERSHRSNKERADPHICAHMPCPFA